MLCVCVCVCVCVHAPVSVSVCLSVYLSVRPCVRVCVFLRMALDGRDRRGVGGETNRALILDECLHFILHCCWRLSICSVRVWEGRLTDRM